LSERLEYPTDKIGFKALRGGAIVMGSTLLQRIGGLVILAILARLLSPEEYGLLGMVFVVTSFLAIFSDMGLSLAAIQKTDLSPDQISNLFWINLLLGVLLGAFTALAAPGIAAFYGRPELLTVTLFCALNFPLAALGALHGALLQRRMAFGRMTLAEGAGLIGGGVVGILLAWYGAGVYALVGQQLTKTLVTTTGRWLFTGWRPRLWTSRAGLRSMIRFGGHVTVYNIVNCFSRNFDKILLGRFCGAVMLGLYTRAYVLMTFPIQLISLPVSQVMIPTLSSLQNDLPRLRQTYLHSIRILAFLSFPIMGYLILVGDDILGLLYGAKWQDAGSIFRILCLAGLWQGIYNATGQLFIVSGRTDRQLKAGLAMALLLGIAFILGVSAGAQGIAIAYVIAFHIGFLPFAHYAYATVGLRLIEVWRTLWPLLLSMGAALPLTLVSNVLLLDRCSIPVRVSLVFIVITVQYLILSGILHRNIVKKISPLWTEYLLANKGRFGVGRTCE
jgi:O-antigen/teichoic acid export membrane protein